MFIRLLSKIKLATIVKQISIIIIASDIKNYFNFIYNLLFFLLCLGKKIILFKIQTEKAFAIQ